MLCMFQFGGRTVIGLQRWGLLPGRSMFRGITVLFGGGLSSARKKIFAKIFTDQGGVVITRTKSGLQSTQFDPSLNYIIVENTRISRQKLCLDLKCSALDDNVKVLDCKWIEQCMSGRSFVDPSHFEVKGVIESGCTDILPANDITSSDSASSKRPLEDVYEECLSRGETTTAGALGGRCKKSRPDLTRPCMTAGVILRHGDKIFMVQPTGSCGYGIPKGRMEQGETPEEAARREFEEETGLRLPVGPLQYLPGSGSLRGDCKAVHTYLADGHGTEVYVSSNPICSGFRKGLPENSGGRYFSLTEALRVCHKNQVRLLELYRAHFLLEEEGRAMERDTTC